VAPEIVPPEGVEVSVRSAGRKRVAFLVNHTEEEKTVSLPRRMTDLLTGASGLREVRLGRHGVAVLK